MKDIAGKIEATTDTRSDDLDRKRAALQNRLDGLNDVITNITNVIASGFFSIALTKKLAEVEQEKAQIETDMEMLERRETAGREVTVDPLLIPHEYSRLNDAPSSPAYKDFIQSFIKRVEVGRYGLTITIKTGLDVVPELDTVLTVRRQEVYERKGGL